jgi:hypothetical protein
MQTLKPGAYGLIAYYLEKLLSTQAGAMML